jgi:hypothetical protein
MLIEKKRNIYPNGYPRTVVRGWLHLLFTIISGSILLRLPHLLSCDNFYFLLFDFLFMANSSIYHNYDSLHPDYVKYVLLIDYVFIVLREVVYNLHIHTKVVIFYLPLLKFNLLLASIVIFYMLKSHLGNDSEEEKEKQRNIQYFMIFIIGSIPFGGFFRGYGEILNYSYLCFYVINEIVACSVFYFEPFKSNPICNFHDIFHILTLVTTISLYLL